LLGRTLLAALCLGLILGLAMVSFGEQPDLDALIGQLGHDDFDQREQASRQLGDLGEPALVALKAAGKHPDAEIRRRAAEIVTQIERRLYGEIAVLVGHTDGLWAAVFSPDGKRAATCSDDKSLRIWQVESGRLLASFDLPSAINCARFFRDGNRLLVGLANGHLAVYDVRDGKRLVEVGKHEDEVVGVEILPGETDVISVSRDRSLRRWNLATTSTVRTCANHSEMIRNVALAPSGTVAATASFDGSVRVWNLDTGDEIQVIRPEGGMVFGVAFAPDGKRLATGSADRTARVWDVESGEEIQRLEGHTGFVYSVQFLPDGKRLISAGEDRSVRVWNLATGAQTRAFTGHNDYVRWVELSPDGKWFLSASKDHTARLWNVPRE